VPLNSGVWKMHCSMDFTKQVFPKFFKPIYTIVQAAHPSSSACSEGRSGIARVQ